MNYEIVGPYTYKEFCSNGIIDKIADVNDTLKIFNQVTNKLENFSSDRDYIELVKEKEKYGEIKSIEKFEKLKSRKKELENILHGNIITSTMSKGIPEKGIEINGKLVPFNPYFFAHPIVSMEFLKSHPILNTTFSNSGLKNLYRFIEEGQILNFSCYSGGGDSGEEWESRITFDVDYNGEFMLFIFDDLFSRGAMPTEYNAFLKK